MTNIYLRYVNREVVDMFFPLGSQITWDGKPYRVQAITPLRYSNWKWLVHLGGDK
jgi:hypothetical protein